MERNTVTTLGNLRKGDRFHFLKSAKKEVWEVMSMDYQLVQINLPLGIPGTYKYTWPVVKKRDQMVVFLRHTAESDIAQQPLKLPNE